MELYSIGVHLLCLIFHSFIFGFTLCDIWVKIQINILQLFFALLQIKRNYEQPKNLLRNATQYMKVVWAQR